MKCSSRTLAAVAALLVGDPAHAQSTTRASVDPSGVEGNNDSAWPTISADGRFVAFESKANNLVSGDTNRKLDVFVHDEVTGGIDRVSVDSYGTEGNRASSTPSISGDGRYVAFQSNASNLVPSDTNSTIDVFVHDRVTGITERASVDSSGAEGNSSSIAARISSDGRFVAFVSYASNLVPGDTNSVTDIFVHDRTTAVTERVSVDASGAEGDGNCWSPSLSADGRFVAFESFSSNLVAGDTDGANDVFVRDRTLGLVERASVDSSGAEENGGSFSPSISANGQVVVFSSDASNLDAGDTNRMTDVFVHDQTTGVTQRIDVDSFGAQTNNYSYTFPASISEDGDVVAFGSDASNLVPGDGNGAGDVFVHVRSTGITEIVSVDSAGAHGGLRSLDPSLSADGEKIAFQSSAVDLVTGDQNQCDDVFVHERCSIAAAWSNYGAGWPGTNGVPSLLPGQDPVLGTTITVDLANSCGSATPGLLFIGFQQASIHSSWGGDLLVLPSITTAIALPTTGMSFIGNVPNDDRLCGFEIDLQAIESDAGASKGVSFTQGLQLVLGH